MAFHLFGLPMNPFTELGLRVVKNKTSAFFFLELSFFMYSISEGNGIYFKLTFLNCSWSVLDFSALLMTILEFFLNSLS